MRHFQWRRLKRRFEITFDEQIEQIKKRYSLKSFSGFEEGKWVWVLLD